MRKTIFPISYYQGQVEDNQRLKEDLLPFIESTKNILKPPRSWLTTKVITSIERDDINQFLMSQKEIQRQYHNVIKTFFDNKFDVEVDECWYNYYEDEEYQESHNHLSIPPLPPNHFSCVHFLCYDKKVHSPLTFSDPIGIIRSHSLEFDSHNYSELFFPDINEGDLIMFPSYLMHEVKASKPTPGNPRISISFNFKVIRYDSHEYS